MVRSPVLNLSTVAKPLVGDYLKRVEAVGERARHHGRTDWERGVLKLIAESHTNHEIAGQLVITCGAVERYRANIMDDFRLRGRTERVA